MRLKNWLYLFWTTLLIGGVAAIAVGMLLRAFDQEVEFFGLSAIGFNLITMLLGGFMFSVVSQMGFFAYLTLNYIVRGIFRSRVAWQYIQLFIFIVVMFEAGYLPYLNFADGKGFATFFALPLILALASIAVAYWKSKLTNMSAFIPTLFFMGAGTVIEAVPVLRMDNMSSTIFMIIPLFLCNAWQILKLHQLVSQRPAAAEATTAGPTSATNGDKGKSKQRQGKKRKK